MIRRYFPLCAKGGHAWKHGNANFVCPDHEGPGLFTHCARCGKEWDKPSRCWVCHDCLIVKVAA